MHTYALERSCGASPRGFKSHSLRGSETLLGSPNISPIRPLAIVDGHTGQESLQGVEGKIRQRGPDSRQVRVSLGRDPVTGRYRYLSRYFHGTKREAQRFAAQLVTQVDRGSHQHPGKLTVAELLHRWMEHIETQARSPSTLVRNRSVIRANIVPRLGSVRIDRLGPADLDHFYAALAKSGLKLSVGRRTPCCPPHSTRRSGGTRSTATRPTAHLRRRSGARRSCRPTGPYTVARSIADLPGEVSCSSGRRRSARSAATRASPPATGVPKPSGRSLYSAKLRRGRSSSWGHSGRSAQATEDRS